jgi:hypothetical protein
LGNLGNLGDLAHHLPTDPTQALSTVQGVVGEVTGGLGTSLPTGPLAGLTSGHLDPSTATHALGTAQSAVGAVASHSAVTDVTTSTGAGNLLGSLDHADVGTDLGHVTSDLHLPSLF